MELILTNVSFEEFNLDFKLEGNGLIGITGEDSLAILKFLTNLPSYKGQIKYNKEKLTKGNTLTYKKKLAFIEQEPDFPKFIDSVKDYFLYIIRQNEINTKDDQHKINTALKIVGLDTKYKERKLINLSSSEKKLIQIAINLLSNPDIILFHEPFKKLDLKHEKTLIMLLQRMQEQYGKIIVIATSNSNILYKYTKNIIILKNKKVLLSGPTKEGYMRVDYLKKNKFDIPKIVEFVYKARKDKNVKIDYHQDIRDLIKDIYKHV